MHLVRELLVRHCLHKEPGMFMFGIYCSHCVAQNLEILACCIKKVAVSSNEYQIKSTQKQCMVSLDPPSCLIMTNYEIWPVKLSLLNWKLAIEDHND